MKLSKLFLPLFLCFLSAEVWGQEIYYKPDTSFYFRPALFDTTLFEWSEIQGVYENKLILSTSIDNETHTLLVDGDGKLLYDFKAEYRLPRNYQNTNGFWMYKIAAEGMNKNELTVAFFDVVAFKIDEKRFGLGSALGSYTYNDASIMGDLFKIRLDNYDKALINLKDNWVKRVPNAFDNCDAVWDSESNKIRLVGQMPQHRDSCALYEFSKEEEIKGDARPIWIKKLKDMGISPNSYYKRFYSDSQKSFYFPGEFGDSTTVAARYDLEGNLIGRFQVPYAIRGEKIYDFYLNANVQYLNDTWYLLDEKYNYSYMQSGSEKARNLKLEPGFKLPALSLASQKGFYLNYPTKLVHVAEGGVKAENVTYTIPKYKKTMPLRAVYTEANGNYWVKYAAPNRANWIRYNGVREIMRTADSLNLVFNPELMDNNSIWLQQGHVRSQSGKYYRRWARYDKDNNYKLLKEEVLFDGGQFLHFDPYRQQFYALSDSLRRYNADFSLDKRFKSEVQATEIGSVLVSKEGNVYIGNSNYPLWSGTTQPHTYKMGANGKLIWKDRIRELRNAAFMGLGSADPGYFLPMLAFEDMILWGSWSCSEGCHINANHALNEESEKVQLPYITEEPASIRAVGAVFTSKYGLTLKNHNKFMKYDAANGTFQENTGLLFAGEPEFWHSDIQPDSSVLAINKGRLYKYKASKRASEQLLATASNEIDIRVYPNPMVGRRVFIESEYGISRIEMVNGLGQKNPILLKKEANGYSIAVGSKAPGVYFLKIADGRRQEKVFRLFVD